MTRDVGPSTHGFGLFGSEFGYPAGGFCLSTFLVVRRRGRLLAGEMERGALDTWRASWAPNLSYYDDAMLEAAFSGFRFPATYVREGEHPDAAARRVWEEQLGFAGELEPPVPEIVSEAGPSRRSPGHHHWDVVFIYEIEGPVVPDPPPEHWAKLDYVEPGELDETDFVMLHGELLSRALGAPG